jgi:septal ring factor EnvC (AmiA/AmiB activator)
LFLDAKPGYCSANERLLARDMLALAAALQQAEREREGLLDAIERLNETIARLQAALEQAERERDELARTLALAVADLREAEARLAEARKALAQIEHFPFDVMREAHEDRSAMTEIARAALAATEGDG